jgi:hypothetical protein
MGPRFVDDKQVVSTMRRVSGSQMTSIGIIGGRRMRRSEVLPFDVRRNERADQLRPPPSEPKRMPAGIATQPREAPSNDPAARRGHGWSAVTRGLQRAGTRRHILFFALTGDTYGTRQTG